MNKVYCYCHFAGVYQCVRTRARVGASGGGGCYVVGEEYIYIDIYTYHYTVTTRMIPALDGQR